MRFQRTARDGVPNGNRVAGKKVDKFDESDVSQEDVGRIVAKTASNGDENDNKSVAKDSGHAEYDVRDGY